MAGRPARDHWVVCPDYAAGPYAGPDAARAALAQIERLGACHGPHAIVQQARKPEIRRSWAAR